MRLNHQLIAAVLASGCSKDKVESVFRIDCQSRHLGSLYALVLGDDARSSAIAIETQASQVCRSEIDLVPFENNGSLRSVPAAKDRSFWGGEAIGTENRGLERGEGLLGG